MRNPKLALLVLLTGILSCTAQKNYELVLNIKDSAPTLDQLDSTVNVVKKRLQAYDKGNTLIKRSPNQQSIILQTACGDLDFIGNVLVKKGSLVFYECYTIDQAVIGSALQNADKAMSESLKGNTPILLGESNAAFHTENPLFHLMMPNQGYQDRQSGIIQYLPAIATVLDSQMALVNKCLPFLYQYLPEGSKLLFKKMDGTKYKAHEMYIVKNDATALNASRYIAGAIADMDFTKHPVITMSFNNVGAKLWERMTTKNVGTYIAIVVDGQLMSAPMVNGPIKGGNTQISGSFTFEQARDLATTLGSGYQPLTLQIGSIKLVANK